MVQPIYSSGFELQDEDTYLLTIKEVRFVEVEDKGLTAKVSNIIEEGKKTGSEFAGTLIFESFPLYEIKGKYFGLARFFGMLVKSLDMPEKEYDNDYFNDVKKQQQVISKAPGHIYGGKAVHVKSKQSDNIFVNIKEYYTHNEYRRINDAGDKPTGSNADSPSTGATEVEPW